MADADKTMTLKRGFFYCYFDGGRRSNTLYLYYSEVFIDLQEVKVGSSGGTVQNGPMLSALD